MNTLVRSLLWLPAATLVFSSSTTMRPAAIEADTQITGTVTDVDTGTPIQAAQVWIEGTQLGALTDASGTFLIVVPEGTVLSSTTNVVAEIIGYARQTSTLPELDSYSGVAIHIGFTLTQQALSLESLVVTATPTDGAGAARRADRDDRAAPVMQAAEAVVGPRVKASGNAGYPGAPSWARSREAGGEQYALIEENGFRRVVDHPLSTFSTDVDRASYSNVRRFLLSERRLPPVDAVQIEEMINYFSYDYAAPRRGDPIGVTTEVGIAPWNRRHRLLRIGLATESVEMEDLPPANLVFLIDVSGSMQSSDKLPLVKRSLRLLVEQLRPEDRVALVVYAGAAGVVLESTSGRERERILHAIDALEAGGSTAGGQGLNLAYRIAAEHFDRDGNNRVILATDGDFNVGESSDAAMIRLIEERREQGTFLTVLGFGTGNLQSSKMQSIAQHGNGTYAYVDGIDEARKLFVGELGGTLLTVAKDVKLQVEFNPAEVEAYRLIGYENRLLADEDFNDDERDAGDIGAGHRVTALYEVIPTGARSWTEVRDVDPLRYQERQPRVRSSSDELAFVRIRYKAPDGRRSRLIERPVRIDEADPSEDFSFVAAVAGFGMILRDSEHRGTMTTHDVLELAHDGMGPDLDGYRRGFIHLVEAYRRVADEHGPR